MSTKKIRTQSAQFSLAWALVAASLGGCGSGSSGTSDGGDGAEGTGGEPLPPSIVGDQCGDDIDNLGWKVNCVVDSLVYDSNSDALLASLPDCPFISCGFLLPNLFENAFACCEGSAPAPTTDIECQGVCLKAACKKAEAAHNAMIYDSCPLGPAVFGGNGFDFQGCLSGDLTAHVFHCNFTCGGDEACNDQYQLQIDCEAHGNEVAGPDGWFQWINDGDPDNDHDMCVDSQTLTLAPKDFGLQDSASEALGTVAEVTWSTINSYDVETTADIEVDISYDVVGCSSGSCLELSRLDLSTSDFSVEGVAIADPTLSLVGVGSLPTVNGQGNFVYPAGTLEFMLDYVVAGGRETLTGTNSGMVTGYLNPASNVFMISNLDFSYTDVMIQAALSVDIVGDYTERAPVASFVRVSEPKYCTSPVVFDATSTDADSDPLTHHWQVDGGAVSVGTPFSKVLSAGDHVISLLTTDDHGRSDVAVVGYTRSCR
jgi:hypothetical protein